MIKGNIMSEHSIKRGDKMSRPVIKKKQIEAAAVRLFANKGIPATTIRDIAKEAKVAEGTLYRYYSSKNEMAWELFCFRLDNFFGKLQVILTSRGLEIKERVRLAIRFIYEYYQNDRDDFNFIILSQHGFPENEVTEDHNPYLKLAWFMADEMQKGKVEKQDPSLLSAMVFGIVVRPLILHNYHRLNREPSQFIEEVINAVYKLMGI